MSFPELRKVVTYDEDILTDGGRACSPVLRMIGVAAVVTNPWYGRGFVEDLQPEIRRMAPVLGKMLTDRLIALAGSGDAIEAYGKAALCGTSCELEHGSALIHTLRFEHSSLNFFLSTPDSWNVTSEPYIRLSSGVSIFKESSFAARSRTDLASS